MVTYIPATLCQETLMYESDAALKTPPVNTTPGHQYASATRTWQGIPGLERTPDGTLWATWYTGGITEDKDNYVLLVKSEDDGCTWSDPLVVIDPPGIVRAFDECIWCDPQGRLWLFWAQSHDVYDGRAGVWCIRCAEPARESLIWTSPRRIADGVMLNKPVVLRTGEWLLPAAVWQYDPMPVRDYPTPQGEAVGQCDVLCTEDNGETFFLRGGANLPYGQGYEHMVVQRQDGSLWMLMRTEYGIGQSESFDGGKTWTPGTETDLGGPDARFFLRRLKSGRLLLVNHVDYMSREGQPCFTKRNNLTAMLSDDDGRTWRGGLVLDDRFQTTYPDGTQSDDGRVYITYDRERADAREILMAVFREEDIMAGSPVTSDARLKVLIDKIR